MRTVNEQKRGLYRVLGTEDAGNVILRRVRKRLWTAEWKYYSELECVKIVCTALDLLHYAGMEVNRPRSSAAHG